ncbi:NAC domain containing protein 82 [Raphanus sativus]|uniref:NAC domain-containing protein 82 n=1 Tax=Raphanus sativus TaxID=3726 RepID=A0A9W3D4R9_RAPSA|nr:NAC domain-containing protein 82 [Raphanus sativus]KAJ4911798.1 NAC domain containing protein 82 [Raphanus sativus]
MGKTQLAPGFRFHPTDVELVRYYLKRKVLGKKLLVDAIAELDIYKFEPSDLPDKSYIKSGDLKWHFFCPREKKYSTGVRANRATACGYWKTTGKERDVLCNGEVAGKIKTLVYHFGKSPRGERTDWVMHEYRLEDKVLTQKNVPQDTYVLCVLFKKDGPGPRNGAQYGAPYKDEDWSDEEHDTGVPATNAPAVLHGETSLVVASSSHVPNKDCFVGMIAESCVSDFLQATTTASDLPQLNDAANTPLSAAAPLLDSNSIASLAPPTLEAPNNDDDLYSMLLDLFVDEDEYFRFSEFNNTEMRHDPNVSAPICLGEGEDIFSELPEFSNMQHTSVPRTPSYDLIENSELYLDLQDLTAPLAPPQIGNVSDSYLSHQGQFDFSTAANDEDPYGFSASMGQGPDMKKRFETKNSPQPFRSTPMSEMLVFTNQQKH